MPFYFDLPISKMGQYYSEASQKSASEIYKNKHSGCS